jgi:hypothetical protein
MNATAMDAEGVAGGAAGGAPVPRYLVGWLLIPARVR